MSSMDTVEIPKTREQRLRKHRDLLVESIRANILPALAQQGFAIVPRTHPPVDPKSVGIFPFGQLRRARPDGGLDMVEIQLMTYQRAAFRINACAVPKEGMRTLGGHRNTEECLALGVHDLEMYACPKWWIWFSLWFWRFRSPAHAEYEKLALRVAGLLPEIEQALSERKLGPHVRRLVLSARLR